MVGCYISSVVLCIYVYTEHILCYFCRHSQWKYIDSAWYSCVFFYKGAFIPVEVAICMFDKKSLGPRDHNSCICFQDPVEHTQEVQNEPFSLQISDIFFSSADVVGKRRVSLLFLFFFFFESKFYNMYFLLSTFQAYSWKYLSWKRKDACKYSS